MQELTDKQQRYSNQIEELIKQKKRVGEERKVREEQYTEVSKEYRERVKQFEKKHRRKVGRYDVIFGIFAVLLSIIGTVIVLYCDYLLWKAHLAIALFIVCLMISFGVISWIITGIIPFLVYEIIYKLFDTNTEEALKKYSQNLLQNYPHIKEKEDDYNAICCQEKEISDFIENLGELKQKNNEQLKLATNELKSIKKKIKDRIDKIR